METDVTKCDTCFHLSVKLKILLSRSEREDSIFLWRDSQNKQTIIRGNGTGEQTYTSNTRET